MAVTGSSPSSRTRGVHRPQAQCVSAGEPVDSDSYRHNELAKLATLSRALISTIDLEQLLGNVADDIIKVVGMSQLPAFI